MAHDNYMRDTGGRFGKGNPGGPGRPPREREESYLAAMTDVVNEDDWREIVQKAVNDAKDGDPRARQWLSDYLLGRPKQNSEVVVNGDCELQVRSQVMHEILLAAERKPRIIDDAELDRIMEAELAKPIPIEG